MTTIDLGPIEATFYAKAPETSRLSAEAAAVTRSARALDMLNEYADVLDGMTADEASASIGITVLAGRPVVCRLRKEGYLTWMLDNDDKPVRRINESGKHARVLEITIKGWKVLGQ